MEGNNVSQIQASFKTINTESDLKQSKIGSKNDTQFSKLDRFGGDH